MEEMEGREPATNKEKRAYAAGVVNTKEDAKKAFCKSWCERCDSCNEMCSAFKRFCKLIER